MRRTVRRLPMTLAVVAATACADDFRLPSEKPSGIGGAAGAAGSSGNATSLGGDAADAAGSAGNANAGTVGDIGTGGSSGQAAGGFGATVGTGGSSGQGYGGFGGCLQVGPDCVPYAPGIDQTIDDSQPVETSTAVGVEGFVVHGTELTWMSNGSIFRADDDTWNSPTSVVSDPSLEEFAVDVDTLYWAVDTGSSSISVLARPLAVTSGPGTNVYESPVGTSAVALRASGERPGFVFLANGQLFFYPGSGQTPKKISVGDGFAGPAYVAKDVVLYEMVFKYDPSELYAASLPDGYNAKVPPAEGSFGLAVGDAHHVVFATDQVVATNQFWPLILWDWTSKAATVIAVGRYPVADDWDGTNVVWAEYDHDTTSSVFVSPAAGGPRTKIATESAIIGAIGVGTAYVYWVANTDPTDASKATLQRVPRTF